MRNLAVGLVAGLAFGGSCAFMVGVAIGKDAGLSAIEVVADDARYHRVEAHRAHRATANRMGLASEDLRACLVEARVTP